MPMSKQQGRGLVAELADYIHEVSSLRDDQSDAPLRDRSGGRARNQLARHYGMKHALCVSSATNRPARTCLWLLELKGSAFVTTPYTLGRFTRRLADARQSSHLCRH
jgi:hypothetical protein